jgi:hypothetical protein
MVSLTALTQRRKKLYEHVQNEESLTQKEKRGKGNNKAL